MSNEVRLSELFRHTYEGGSTSSGDEIHHQLMNGLGCLMNVGDNLDACTRAVALASIASAIRRFRDLGECPTSMYFAETFPSLSEKDRARVLQLVIPHLVSTSNCYDNAQWFIGSAIELELYPLIHLTFIEDAMNSPDPRIRIHGAIALTHLPLSYWEEKKQLERRTFLLEQLKRDGHELVRLAINELPKT